MLITSSLTLELALEREGKKYEKAVPGFLQPRTALLLHIVIFYIFPY
jgi:hypothetical protein